MKYYNFIISLVLVLTSCSSLSPYNYDTEAQPGHIMNGCLIDALNFQAVLDAKQGLNPAIWSKILHTVWDEDGETYGHSYCVYKTKNGNLYAYDRTGSMRINPSTDSAMDVAQYLNLRVRKAWYDEKEK